jgi:hypothetical protein
MPENYFWPSGREKCFSLDIPFYRTVKPPKKKCRQCGGGLDAGKLFLAFRQGEVFFT